MTPEYLHLTLQIAKRAKALLDKKQPQPDPTRVATLALGYLLNMSEAIPLLAKEITRLQGDLDLAAKVINDISQEPAFQMGVAHATQQFRELVQQHLVNNTQYPSRWEGLRNLLDEIHTSGPYTHPQALSALRKICALPAYSGSHGPAPGLDECQQIAREALGEIDPK